MSMVDLSKSPFAKLYPISIENIRLEDSFWAPRIEILRRKTLPSQYDLMVKTGRIFNFRRASGKEKGDFKGYYFNDSDVYKWVEAVSYTLVYRYDEKLYCMVRKVIDDIIAAQDDDGYLNTYFTFERRKDRWKNLRDMHELYCAGHLFQAAIAFYRSTGEKDLLDTAIRFADHISNIFGPDKREGTPGHPEIEMALVELYRLTKVKRYLDLAKFFLDNRGKGLIGGSIVLIDHKPFRELDEIVGHAVRSLYLNCGATDIYLETGEKGLWDTLTRLWSNMVGKKLYITGGAGSRYSGESFGDSFELPNYRAYCETCASIANIMWNWRMLMASGDSKYNSLIELILYNAALAGISLDGTKYFYVNPLADRGFHRRKTWFSCACCPPNIARLIASLPGYIYSISKDTINIHLYIQSKASILLNDTVIKVEQYTNYPWSGDIKINIIPETRIDFTIGLFIPGWVEEAHIKYDLNKHTVYNSSSIFPGSGSYFKISNTWKNGVNKVYIYFKMPVRKVISHPHVLENTCKVALRRGPLVYCLEQVDNDFDVWDLVIDESTEFNVIDAPNLLNGIKVIEGNGIIYEYKKYFEDESHQTILYRTINKMAMKRRKVKFKAIPYYAWGNRRPGPMTTWIKWIKKFN